MLSMMWVVEGGAKIPCFLKIDFPTFCTFSRLSVNFMLIRTIKEGANLNNFLAFIVFEDFLNQKKKKKKKKKN